MVDSYEGMAADWRTVTKVWLTVGARLQSDDNWLKAGCEGNVHSAPQHWWAPDVPRSSWKQPLEGQSSTEGLGLPQAHCHSALTPSIHLPTSLFHFLLEGKALVLDPSQRGWKHVLAAVRVWLCFFGMPWWWQHACYGFISSLSGSADDSSASLWITSKDHKEQTPHQCLATPHPRWVSSYQQAL